MAKHAKIDRNQKEFLKRMKAKFAEEPKPATPDPDTYHPTILPYHCIRHGE